MTACESSGYTGASVSITLSPPFLGRLVVVGVSNLIGNIPRFRSMSNVFPLPVNRCWCWLFFLKDSTRAENRPLLRPFSL